MDVETATRIVLDTLAPSSVDATLLETPGDEQVFAIVADGHEYFLKVSDPAGMRRQVWCLQTARALGVPTPHVVVHTLDPEPCFLMERIRGVPLSTVEDPEIRAAIGCTLGELVARLHSLEVAGFGWINAHEEPPLGRSPSWRDAIQGIHRWSLSYIEEHDVLDRALRLRAVDRISAADAWLGARERRSFLHGDLYEGHVFVDPHARSVEGLIDFHGWSGDPGWDLATLCYFDPSLGAAIFNGYGSVPDGESNEFYALTLLLNIARWVHERKPNDTGTLTWAREQIEQILTPV